MAFAAWTVMVPRRLDVVNADPPDKLPMRLLHDRVLVALDGEAGERRSSGGIVIPATAQVGRRLSWARVVAVGNNVRTVEVGDRVLFDPADRAEVEPDPLWIRVLARPARADAPVDRG